MKYTSAVAATASGSLGGMTASRNRGGQYMRRRSIPINPNTAKQVAVRAYFQNAVEAWNNTLTAAQRTAWTVYAANTPRVDTLGQALVLTGQQAWIGHYVPRAQAGISPVLAAPIVFNTGEAVVGVMATNSGTANVLGIDGANLSMTYVSMSALDSAGQTLLYVGRPVNPSVNFYRGPYQFAAAEAFTAGGTTDAFAGVVADLPLTSPLVANQRRSVRLVNAFVDGRTAVAFEAMVAVLADP